MNKVQEAHLQRDAYVYVRQSSPAQVLHNVESGRRQYALPDRASAKAHASAMETYFPQARRCELFTGHLSARNLYLYEKLDYHKFKSEKVSDKLTKIFLEKELAAPLPQAQIRQP